MDWQAVMTAAKEFGVTAVGFAFFVWWVYRLVQGMRVRLNEVEDYQRNKLEALVVTNTTALTNHTHTMERICAALEDRPCIAREMGVLKETPR